MMRKHGSKYGGEMQGKPFDMLLICNRRIVGAGMYGQRNADQGGVWSMHWVSGPPCDFTQFVVLSQAR